MTIRRIVAAESDSTLLTCAEMNPSRADPDTIGTFVLLRQFYPGDGANVGAGRFSRHEYLSHVNGGGKIYIFARKSSFPGQTQVPSSSHDHISASR